MDSSPRYASRGPYRRGAPPTQGNFKRGEARHGAKLTEADVIRMREMRAQGEKTLYIALQFPQVSKVTVEAILRREKWKHVP